MKQVIYITLCLIILSCGSNDPNQIKISSGIYSDLITANEIKNNELSFDCQPSDTLIQFAPNLEVSSDQVFSFYPCIVEYAKQNNFNGKIQIFYDLEQSQIALEYNSSNGLPNGKMIVFNKDESIKIERIFEEGSLYQNRFDIGNIDWSLNRNENNLTVSTLVDDDRDDFLSILYSPDLNQAPFFEVDEPAFNSSQPLKVNGKVFNGTIFYHQSTNDLSPNPSVEVNFLNGFLTGKASFYVNGMVDKVEFFNKGVNAPLDVFESGHFTFEGKIDSTVFRLKYRLQNDSVLEGGSLNLTQGFPSQYYILNGQKANDTISFDMIKKLDERASTIEHEKQVGEKYKLEILLKGLTATIISNKDLCNYCCPDLKLSLK